MNKKIEEILSNIKSIGYYLASKNDINANLEFREQIGKNEKYLTSDITDLKLSDLQFNLDALKELYKIKIASVLKIKIFIASSDSLKEEREAIETFLFRKNDELVEKGIYLSYNVWEKQSRRFTHTDKQKDFNILVYDSEIFICLIGDNVGTFTKEEFGEAKKKFDANEKPFVFYVYFKEFEGDELIKAKETDGGVNWTKRIELNNHINRELKQVAGTFKNKDELIRIIERGLAEDIEIVKQKKDITV